MPRRRSGRGRHHGNRSAFDAALRRSLRLVVRNIEDTDDEEGPAVKTKAIKVKKIELNIESNTKAHHTDEFYITDVKKEKPSLVVRRGQPFDLSVVFNRVYDETKDDLRILFQFGDTPNPSKGTRVGFMLSAKDIPKEWGGFIKKADGDTLQLQIMTPPNIPVGKWTLSIDVKTDVSTESYLEPNPIYMLFNPWCKDDQVYMPEEHLNKEYVLNENGKIFVGSEDSISGRKWHFGQFEKNVLDCCLYLLDQSSLQDHAKGDPVKVCRQLSAMVNSSDDDGVLTGKWSGKYHGGKSPVSWAGSVTILQQYYKEKKPVKYGQCWVFSGVLTTVCRALGVPARSITNFESAHDSDGSATIDYMFDGEDLNDDSIWNFHVWNDVWMTRPDLPEGYGGWQAIDATPQETSDGTYCMGPMSLMAIKRGDLNMPYDGVFAFAEVNADVRYMVLNDKSLTGLSCVYVKKHSVGKKISTHRPSPASDGDDREDITDQYKFPEGSQAERVSVTKAINYSTIKSDDYKAIANDVHFEITYGKDMFFGDDILINLKMKNNSSETRIVEGRITLSSIYYTGLHCMDVDTKLLQQCVIEPNSEETVTMSIPENAYFKATADHCFFRASCMTSVQQTRQIYTNIVNIRLRKPHLTIKAPARTTVGENFNAEVSFVNPLSVTLTECEVVAEGPGISGSATFKLKNVGPKQTLTDNLTLKPKKVGDKEIVINFNSKEVMGVNGSHKITVTR